VLNAGTRVVWAAVLIGGGAAFAPARAYACAVCGLGGTRDNWLAYFTMTWVMSGLPVAMIAGLAFWVYRRVSAHDADADAIRTAASIGTVRRQPPAASDINTR
jgi:hypothetical protein